MEGKKIFIQKRKKPKNLLLERPKLVSPEEKKKYKKK